MSTDPVEPNAGDLTLVATNDQSTAYIGTRSSNSGTWSLLKPLTPANNWRAMVAANPVAGLTTDTPSQLLQLTPGAHPPLNVGAGAGFSAAAVSPIGHAYYSAAMAIAPGGSHLPLYIVQDALGPVVFMSDQVPHIGAGSWNTADPLVGLSLDWQGFPQLCVVTAGGNLHHTQQTGLIGEEPPPQQPVWTDFLGVKSEIADPGPVVSAACTRDFTQYQLFFLNAAGHVFQVSKPLAKGTVFGDLVDLTDLIGPFDGIPVQIAAVYYNGDFGSGGFFHLALVTSTGGLYHLMSPPDAESAWSTEQVQARTIGTATSVAISVQPWLIP